MAQTSYRITPLVLQVFPLSKFGKLAASDRALPSNRSARVDSRKMRPQMKAQSLATLPLARTKGIITKEIDGELLIYDCARDKAHCLNSSAAAIWKLCDGSTGIPEMAESLSAAGLPVHEAVIHSALRQLRAKALLAESSYVPIGAADTSRRLLARNLGIAVVLLPLITSIGAPTASAAVSCGGPCSGAPGRGSCPAGCLCSGISSSCVVA